MEMKKGINGGRGYYIYIYLPNIYTPNNGEDTSLTRHLFLVNTAPSTRIGLHSMELLAEEVPSEPQTIQVAFSLISKTIGCSIKTDSRSHCQRQHRYNPLMFRKLNLCKIQPLSLILSAFGMEKYSAVYQ